MTRPLPPVFVLDRFPAERQALLGLLRGLSPEQWALPTVCTGWSVKDIALHLLGDDLGVLARHTASPAPDGLESDQYHQLIGERITISRQVFAGRSTATFDDLVPLINQANEAWVSVTRRLATAQLVALLVESGRALHAHFATRAPFALGAPVHWAGPEPAPVWLDIAREYTERWLHQAQIRDAVAAPPLTDAHLFAPVLATFVRALPSAYRDVPAPAGTRVRLIVTGGAGGSWLLARDTIGWALAVDDGGATAATLALDQETSWRLFTKGVTPAAARTRCTIVGDEALALPALGTVAILA